MQEVEFKTGVIRPVECMREGWELIKDDYWIFFAMTLVGMLIAGISMNILLGAMYCGLYYALLKKMNGQRFNFEDLFKGFNFFVPALIATLIFLIPVFLSMFITYGSMFGIMFTMIDARGNVNPAAIVSLYAVLIGEGIFFGILISCIHAFVMFSYPLIAERNMGGWDAFKLSARAVWANLSGVIGLILVEFALGFVGYLACGFGLYFVFPILFAGVAVAYRKVFPAPENPNFNVPPSNIPPQPNAYRDAGSYNQGI